MPSCRRRELGLIDDWAHTMDTTIVRAHAHAAGGKGGLIRMLFVEAAAVSTKIHARVDGQRRPLGFVLTGGDVSDYRGVDELLGAPVTKPKIMLADKGFHGDDVRSALLLKGISPVIPPRANPPRSARLRLQGVSRSKPQRAHVQQAEAVQAHRHAVRQNQAVLRRLPGTCSSQIWLPTFVNAT
jgi:transposase